MNLPSPPKGWAPISTVSASISGWWLYQSDKEWLLSMPKVGTRKVGKSLSAYLEFLFRKVLSIAASLPTIRGGTSSSSEENVLVHWVLGKSTGSRTQSWNSSAWTADGISPRRQRCHTSPWPPSCYWLWESISPRNKSHQSLPLHDSITFLYSFPFPSLI